MTSCPGDTATIPPALGPGPITTVCLYPLWALVSPILKMRVITGSYQCLSSPFPPPSNKQTNKPGSAQCCPPPEALGVGGASARPVGDLGWGGSDSVSPSPPCAPSAQHSAGRIPRFTGRGGRSRAELKGGVWAPKGTDSSNTLAGCAPGWGLLTAQSPGRTP